MKFVLNKYLKLKQMPSTCSWLCMLIFALFFRLLLDFSYGYFVFPLYEYTGFTFSFSLTRIIESWVVFIFLLLLLPSKFKKPSDFFMVMFFFGLIAPLSSLYGLTESQPSHFYAILLGYILVLVFRNGKRFCFPLFSEGQKIALLTLVLLLTIVTGWLVVSGATNFFNLSLTKVYEYRELSGNAINLGGMAYLNTMAFKLGGPCLLAIALYRKWYVLAVLVCLLQVFWFGASSHKAVLFYPTLVIFIWYFFERNNNLYIIPSALFLVVFCSLLAYIYFDHKLAASLFIRRTFFVICQNMFDYFIYFQNEPMLLWSNSITSKYIEYPYDLTPPVLIGQWRGTGANVNNSFISMGFMHAGVAGIVLYGVLVGFIFRIIDSLRGASLPNWLIVAALVAPVRAMLFSTDLPTALLTHGLAFGCLLLIIARAGGSRASLTSETDNYQCKKEKQI